MKQKRIVLGLIPLLLIMMMNCEDKPKYPSELDRLVPGASLVFKGKVVLLNTSTTDEDDISDKGVVVVEQMIKTPENFPDLTGDQITVRFLEINGLEVGEKRMFFTEPYWIGESLGVAEIGSVLQDDELYIDKNITNYIAMATDHQEDQSLKELLKESELVVSGQVTTIRKPEAENIPGTEHDPEWRIAEITVDETLKGQKSSESLSILFASGKDVMYFQSPKFKEGDEGIFIVQRAAPDIEKNYSSPYMILNPSCFISGKEESSRIRSLIE